MALRDTSRTYKFRHTGNLDVKYAEARNVLDLAINYEKQFVEVGNRLASEKFSQQAFEDKVLDRLFVVEEDTGTRATANREAAKESILNIWNGQGAQGDTRGNSPNTKWTAYNAVAEYADFGRNYTVRSNQVVRSFEDNALKQRAFDLVSAA